MKYLFVLLLSMPGNPVQWKKADDQIVGRIQKAQLAKMRTTVDALHSFLQDSCFAATGLSPVWRGTYSAESGAKASFGIQCLFTTGGGAGTLSIIANDIDPIFGHLTLNHQEYLTLSPVQAVRKECPYFESQSQTGAHQAMWVVTSRPEELPYVPVTREEYLLSILADLHAMRERTVAAVKERAPVHPAEVQQAAKQKDLDDLAAQYSGPALELRKKMYLEHYKSDEDYQKENIDAATADVDTTIHMIDGIKNHLSPEALRAPAIISPNSTEFEGFRDGEPGMVMLVRMNPAYSDPAATSAGATSAAAPEKPKYFLITWESDNADASSAAFGEQVSKYVEMRMLRDMLKR